MSGPLAGPALYPIRAVSRLTGIGIDTLRAWERRYRAVTPTRDDQIFLNFEVSPACSPCATSTEHGAWRIVLSATLPSSSRRNPR